MDEKIIIHCLNPLAQPMGDEYDPPTMKRNEHTIESGLKALMDKSRYHREQADRFDRLALAFREAEAALHAKDHGDESRSVGRPLNGEARKSLREAIDSLPTEFTLTELKRSAKGLRPDILMRLFRDARKEGVFIEKVRAMGRREGVYLKSEQAAAS